MPLGFFRFLPFLSSSPSSLLLFSPSSLFDATPPLGTLASVYQTELSLSPGQNKRKLRNTILFFFLSFPPLLSSKFRFHSRTTPKTSKQKSINLSSKFRIKSQARIELLLSLSPPNSSSTKIRSVSLFLKISTRASREYSSLG